MDCGAEMNLIYLSQFRERGRFHLEMNIVFFIIKNVWGFLEATKESEMFNCQNYSICFNFDFENGSLRKKRFFKTIYHKNLSKRLLKRLIKMKDQNNLSKRFIKTIFKNDLSNDLSKRFIKMIYQNDLKKNDKHLSFMWNPV